MSRDLWNDLRSLGQDHEAQRFMARLRRSGRHICFVSHNSSFARAFARRMGLAPNEYRVINTHNHVRGVCPDRLAIIVIPGFTQTRLWRVEEELKGLYLLWEMGAQVVYPDGSPVSLNRITEEDLSRPSGDHESPYRAALQGSYSWEDSPTDPVEDLLRVARRWGQSVGNSEAMGLYLQPAACFGCEHYDGKIYGMNRLICGMHPYGPAANKCEDWEGKS